MRMAINEQNLENNVKWLPSKMLKSLVMSPNVVKVGLRLIIVMLDILYNNQIS